MENEWKNQFPPGKTARENSAPGKSAHRIPVFISTGMLALAVLIGIATLAPELLGRGSGFQKVLIMMVEPYAEMMRQSYFKNGEIEYVVFVSGEKKDLAHKVNREPGIRYLGEGALPRSIVVSLSVPIKSSLQRLRNLPFTGMLFRSDNLLFCH